MPGVVTMGDAIESGSSEAEVELEHFVYGSHEGYRMKAHSTGIDLELHTEAFEGLFLPIKQSDVKNISEVRMILPADESSILLSRIVQGGKDDHARVTMANHTAVVPRQLLKDGALSFEDVDTAMASFEKENIEKIGNIPTLSVGKTGKGSDMAELKTYLREDIVRNLIKNYLKNRDIKIFLYYNKSDAIKRTRAAYLLSQLIDINLGLIPLSIFTDVPYGAAKRIFNLVISRAMIDVKPGGDWIMIPVERKLKWTPVDRKRFQKELNELLDDIYG
jgi:hypothetical protein